MNEYVWKPTQSYIDNANITRFMKKHNIASYKELIEWSTNDVARFWEEALFDLNIEWYSPYTKVYDNSKGIEWTKWFIDGKINIVYNCIDRHLEHGNEDMTAFVWEGDDGSSQEISYAELNRNVCKTANLLKEKGICLGDSVGLYMPMCPELIYVFFATLKIGAVSVPVFSGFGHTALKSRLEDANVKILFTADVGFRRGKKVSIKNESDKATSDLPELKTVVTLIRGDDGDCNLNSKDVIWADVINSQDDNCETAVLNAEDVALMIYTSGTTGKPKGTVHTHIGCLAQMTKEIAYYFDYKPNELFFWMTDIGWMMGPWEMIGVSALGGKYMIFEGAPNYPHPGRLWELIEKHKVNMLGISPTAIRLLMTYDEKECSKYDLSSLRILGSTGEPWDPESYKWFSEKVGKSKCPIINISGGTEIVGCLLAPMPIVPLKSCTLLGPGLGMDVDVFDENGKPIRDNIGHLVCKQPAPSMTKGFLNDSDRYIQTYFSKWKGVWYHGDWAKIDKDGYWFLFGRSDDTIKVAGKRTGPAEIESALIEHPAVSEAAAIGIPHKIKGEAVACYVVLSNKFQPSDELREELKLQVVKHLGKTLKPQDLKFTTQLPKTRSAKILRGMIRKLYLNEDVPDISSVENSDSLNAIRKAF